MIIFCGENTLESYLAAREYLQSIKTPKIQIDGEELSTLEELKGMIGNLDLFGDTNTVYAKRLFSNTKIRKDLEKDESLISNDSLVVWEDKAMDSRRSYVKLLAKEKRIHSFEIPKTYKLSQWVVNHAKGYFKLSISQSNADYITKLVGNNLWYIHNELEKLSSYLSVYPKSKIDSNMIELVVSNYAFFDIWTFLDAFTSRDRKKMSGLIPTIVKEDSDIHYLISMINRELRLLAQVLTSEGNQTIAGIHPYVLEKTREKSRHYDMNEVRRLYLDLLRLDSSIKNGEVDPISALYIFLYK